MDRDVQAFEVESQSRDRAPTRISFIEIHLFCAEGIETSLEPSCMSAVACRWFAVTPRQMTGPSLLSGFEIPELTWRSCEFGQAAITQMWVRHRRVFKSPTPSI
jgi:hypothetical protein